MTLLKTLGKILLVLVISLALLEAALTLIDPFGMVFFEKVDWLENYLGRANGSYSLSPGIYNVAGWTVTMNDDATRRVPDSGAGCTLLFTGDSVTWGWGVNDDETFANLIARELGTQAINSGVFGYSSEDVAAALDYYEGQYDLAVYLIYPNDHYYTWDIDSDLQPAGQHTFPGFGLIHSGTPATVWYGVYLTRPGGQPEAEYMDRFTADMDAITGHDHVLLFAFDAPPAAQVRERYDIHLIDWYTSAVSRVDPHPTAAGHQQIAAAMLSTIREHLAALDCV